MSGSQLPGSQVPSGADLSDFEKKRQKNIADNKAQERALLEPFTIDLTTPNPARSKRKPTRKEKFWDPVKPTPRIAGKRGGAWTCDKCKGTFKKTDEFLVHLKTNHSIPFDTENLAPRGLAQCVFCQGIFEAITGIFAHARTCRPFHWEPGIMLPASCFVWWEKEKRWYKGTADKNDVYEDIPIFHVHYPDKTEEWEYTHCHDQDDSPLCSTLLDIQDPLASQHGSVLAECLGDSPLTPLADPAPTTRTRTHPNPPSPRATPPLARVCSNTAAPAPRPRVQSIDTQAATIIALSLAEPTPRPAREVAAEIKNALNDGLDAKHASDSDGYTPPPAPPSEWSFPSELEEGQPERKTALLSQEIVNCSVSAEDEDLEDALNKLLPAWFQEHSLIPLRFKPTKDNVTELITEIHSRSGILRTLPPLELWRWSWKNMWTRSTKEFSVYFKQALQADVHSAEYLKLCLRLFELPFLALADSLTGRKNKTSTGKTALSGKHKKVESLTLQNRLHEATKILFSNGIAPPTNEILEQLQEMHPQLKEPIPELRTPEPQFKLEPAKIKKILFKKCGERWNSMDPYGWNTALLSLVRGDKGPGCFFSLLSTFLSQLIDADVSDLVAFSLSAGSIVGLYKDNEEERKLREEKGLKQRIRPINHGSLFLSLAFDFALHSKPAIQAQNALRPIQQGIGAKRGMEMIAHVADALYGEGHYAILKMDASNGFQNIKRSMLHRAVHKRCPSLLSLFQRYYTKESTCFFDLDNAVRLVRAQEGARMGCKLSSFAFGLTTQDHYEATYSFLTHGGRESDGSCMKAATDDVVVIVKATKILANSEEIFYRRIGKIRTVLNSAEEKLGLTFLTDKEELLLPRDWTLREEFLPAGLRKESVRSNTFEDTKLQGMEIVGAPVGSVAFCKKYVKNAVKKIIAESNTLADLHPQCATKLLKECICAQSAFLNQVCHPNTTIRAMTALDEHVWSLMQKIVGSVGEDRDQLACCETGLERARTRAFLPSRYHGVGLQSAERTAGFAWFCSVAACTGLEDRDLEYARRFLGERALNAYDFALDAVGGPEGRSLMKYTMMPAGDRDVLSDSNFYIELFRDDPNLKLQHEFLDHVCNNEAVDFGKTRRSIHPHLTDSEKIWMESQYNVGDDRRKSILPCLFTAPLTQYDIRMTKTEFQVAARQFLWLPPLKNPIGETFELKCGCEAQKCVKATCRTRDLLPTCDVSGNHSLVCHPGVKAQKATIFERALDKMFRLAGGHPTRQPSAYTLLGGYFPKEDVHSLFSGILNKRQTEERKTLALRYLDLIAALPPGQYAGEEIDALRETFPKVSHADDDANVAIRFDMKFPGSGPVDCPREVWFDHAIVQEASATYADDTLKFLKTREGNVAEGPAFRKMLHKRQRKYSALCAVAKRLSSERKLDFAPMFLYPIMSAFGFMNPDFLELNKFIVDRYKDTLKHEGDRLDGHSPKFLLGRFKVQLRNSLCFALLKGNALAAYNQGLRFLAKPP